jgi:hypothetical protein
MIRTLGYLFLAICAFALAGCKATEQKQDTAQVRVIHLSPDSEALAIKIKDGNTVISSIAPGASSAYVGFAAASTNYEIRSAVDGSLLASQALSFTGGARYTMVITGRRAALGFAALQEDTQSPTTAANFRFRTDNFSTLGSLDVYFVAQSSLVASTAPTISSIGSSALSGYTEVAGGSYQVVLTLAGSKEIVFESAAQNFAAGSTVTLAVAPGNSSRLANVLLLTYGDSGTVTQLSNLRSRVRAVHASPDAPLLAFLNGGVTVFSNVPYKANSGYATSASGARKIDLQAFGVTSSSVASKTFTLSGGADYTVIAVNRFNAIDIAKLDDNNLLPAVGKVRVRFVNLNVDNGAVDVLANFSKSISNLAYLSASSYQDLDAGTYTFAFNTSNANVVVATTDSLTLETGKVYTVFLFGTSTAADTRLVTDS